MRHPGTRSATTSSAISAISAISARSAVNFAFLPDCPRTPHNQDQPASRTATTLKSLPPTAKINPW